MNGINATTGKRLSDLAHLRQSVSDILTTPIGSRVMRREYGSRLFDLIDAPTNRETIVEIYAATAEALMRWEPRIAVTQVSIVAAEPGRLELDIFGTEILGGWPVILDGIVVQ